MEKNFKQIEVECGRYYIDDNGICHYEGDSTANGWCYKDYSAWRNNNGVIYIGEYELEDSFTKNVEDCNFWTKESWINWVRETIKDYYSDVPIIDEILADNDFISDLAYDCFDRCDWQDLTTMFNELDYNDDWVLNNWEHYKNN